MGEKMKKIISAILGREYGFRERIFRVIVLVGSVLAVGGIIESTFIMDVGIIFIPLLALLATLIVALVSTFKYRKIDFTAVLIGVLIIFVIFPLMFLLSGGLEGGAALWFALGLFYIFLMFSGKKLVFFLAMTIIADAATYVVSYYWPDCITPMDSMFAAYVDSFFAVFAVGLASGAILKAQAKMYIVENAVFRKQQEKLKRVTESKDNFFTSVSHEIRTPINTIIGLNEMILRESQEAETKEYARNIQSASKMLLNLINEVLDLSQVEMKQMKIVPIEYRTEELFRDLVDLIHVRLQEKKLEFQVDIDETIPSVLLGDVKRINQVVLNILTNAAKYTETGTVVLAAHVDSLEGDELRLKIAVKDTGIGIRREDLQYLYEAFRRIDLQKNVKVEGSGLGLSITKQLVDLMGGEITVDSIYTKGSTFTITLPQKIVSPEPIGQMEFLSQGMSQTQYHQSFEAPEARILIVDDNSMNTMVERKLLEATKVQVDVAASGEQCLEMTKNKHYHVILMDHLMPGMNGLETMRKLRNQKNSQCRDSAVVVLSAHSAAGVEKNFLDEGFNGYLEKPIQGTTLEAELLKFLPDDIVESRSTPAGEEKVREQKVQRSSFYKRKKVYITTDSASDLPGKYIDKYDIGMMYLYIRTDEGRFIDTLEITTDHLLRDMLVEPDWSSGQSRSAVTGRGAAAEHAAALDSDTGYRRSGIPVLASGRLTSRRASHGAVADTVSVEEYEEFFAEMLTQAEQVVHISVAENVGSTFGNAMAAAQCFDHVRVIDSSQISCGQGLVVLYAGKLAMEGYSAQVICEKLEQVKSRIESRFFVQSAISLHQNGFLGKTVNRMCGLLELHPVLKVSRGKLSVRGFGIGRTEGAGKRFIRWKLFRKGRINTDVVFISHVGCTVEQQEMIRREVLRRIPFKKVIMQRASVTVACHSGPGAFGLAYYLNSRED